MEQLRADAHVFLRSTDVLKTVSGARNESESPREAFEQSSFLVSFSVTPLSSPTLP